MAQGNYSFAFRKTSCQVQSLFQSFQCHINKACFTHLIFSHTRKQTHPSYRLHYELCKKLKQAPCHKSERDVHTREPMHPRAFTRASFCSRLCSPEATTPVLTQQILCIYGHHARARAPWAQPAFSEYRKTCTDPTAVLGLRERHECSPGTATRRPRILRGLRHPRPGPHKGQTHLLLLFIFSLPAKARSHRLPGFYFCGFCLFVCGFFPCPPQQSARTASPSASGAADAAWPRRPSPRPLRPAGLPQPRPARCLHF